MQKFRYFIFDYDGTLSDSVGCICTTMADAFVAFGLIPPTDAQTRHIIGLTLEVAIETLLQMTDQIGDAVALSAAYKNIYHDFRQRNIFTNPLFSGVKQLLVHLDDKGLLSSIATGKAMRGLKTELEKHQIGHHFVSLHTADLYPSKPHPEMIYSAMSHMNADPAHTLMLGDSIYDMQMAKAAGITAIGVSWGCHSVMQLKDAGADKIIDTIQEFYPLIA